MSGGTCTLMSGGAPASSSSNVLTFLSHSAPQHLMVVHVERCMTSIRELTPPMRAPESRVMSVADHDGIFLYYISHFICRMVGWVDAYPERA
jgi:cytochrome b561